MKFGEIQLNTWHHNRHLSPQWLHELIALIQHKIYYNNPTCVFPQDCELFYSKVISYLCLNLQCWKQRPTQSWCSKCFVKWRIINKSCKCVFYKNTSGRIVHMGLAWLKLCLMIFCWSLQIVQSPEFQCLRQFEKVSVCHSEPGSLNISITLMSCCLMLLCHFHTIFFPDWSK